MRQDEGCHPCDEGGRRHVESQMGRRESSSFAGAPAAASVAIKVLDEPAPPRQHLSRGIEIGSFHTTRQQRSFTLSCFFFLARLFLHSRAALSRSPCQYQLLDYFCFFIFHKIKI